MGGAHRHLGGDDIVYIFFICVLKTNRTIHLRSLHFTVYKWEPNRIDQNTNKKLLKHKYLCGSGFTIDLDKPATKKNITGTFGNSELCFKY